MACGTGQGLAFLKKYSKSICGGDCSANILRIAKEHYQNRIALAQYDAQDLPYRENTFDVIILFEAIYYLPFAEKFVSECRRVLRKHGTVLIATANKDLCDFNPSPHSYRYYGVLELEELFSKKGFSVTCFGNVPVDAGSLREQILRPMKKLAVRSSLMPKTANGKKLLKKLVFGSLVKMPAEIEEKMIPYHAPVKLSLGRPDQRHKVIYCAARIDG